MGCTSCCASSSSAALLTGDLDVADLPEAWNTRMREYLGVEVPSDARV